MIAMTTSSSMSVKARSVWWEKFLEFEFMAIADSILDACFGWFAVGLAPWRPDPAGAGIRVRSNGFPPPGVCLHHG